MKYLKTVIVGCAALQSACAAPLEIGQVRCEDAVDPVGTVAPRPRLSWTLRGDEPPTRPAGAEVRVAADAAALRSAAARRTDSLFSWVYDGPALRPGVPYRWQVRLVNADGSGATPWSAPGRFVVALQDAKQWGDARWIGEEPVRVDWRDIDYQVKFSRVTNAFGVFFRARSGTEGYMWQVNFERAAARLRPHVFLPGGKGMRLLPEKDLSAFFPKGLDPAAAHVLKISLRGETIKTFIDGTLVDERTDATFKAGTVGVRTSYAEDALVREVDVRAADGAVLLHDAFNGHVMQAFRNPRTEKGGLRVAGAVYLHPGILPKSCPRLRRTFALADKPIASAIASACGMGFYELWLNGRKADPTRVLAPGMTQPSRALLFDTYDVTALLRPGAENAVGFWLAAGYSDDYSRYGWHWLKPKCAILHLLVRYADGTEQAVVTDGAWEFNPSSPVTYASIYQGETYDASLAEPGWCLPGASAAGWRPAVLSEGMEKYRLLANDEPPVRMLDPRRPVKIVETEPGVFTVDFGQNRAGFVEARVRGPKGTAVSIRTSELLGDDGKIDPWTNVGVRSTDTFVLAGTGAAETYVPRFTYHGFRYVEIRGWPGRPAADDLTAWAVHADVETAGAFRCSNETLNRFFGAALWSMRSNFMSYPTDCAMRVERTPCQMDSQAYEDAALAFFNMTRYYAKWLDDIRGGRGNPDWTGNSVTLAGRLWRETGDARVYAARYDDMKGQVDAFVKRAPDLVCRSGFGDWCAPNTGTWESYFNDVAIVNTSIFCEMARIVAEAARVLGKDEDATRYDALHARAKEAFHRQFYDAKAHAYGDGSQTTAVLPLAFGIVPADCRAAVADQLLRTIRAKNGSRIDTGIFGTRYLGDVLCDLGEGDLFVHMLTQPEYPGFGYMLARGATTLWEQWSFKCGMNSHNHAMFAGAASTLMTRLGGIRPKAPGYAEIEIAPTFPKSLGWAEATRETPRGRVAVTWRRAGGNVELEIEVPPFTSAVLRAPGAEPRPLAPGCQRVVLAAPAR